MGDGTGRLPERGVKRDLAPYMYISIILYYILFVPFSLYGKNFAVTFFVPSGKAGSQFAQPGSRLKRDKILFQQEIETSEKREVSRIVLNLKTDSFLYYSDSSSISPIDSK